MLEIERNSKEGRSSRRILFDSCCQWNCHRPQPQKVQSANGYCAHGISAWAWQDVLFLATTEPRPKVYTWNYRLRNSRVEVRTDRFRCLQDDSSYAFMSVPTGLCVVSLPCERQTCWRYRKVPWYLSACNIHRYSCEYIYMYVSVKTGQSLDVCIHVCMANQCMHFKIGTFLRLPHWSEVPMLIICFISFVYRKPHSLMWLGCVRR